ncbi:dihydrofolate reductase family protein [Mangrovimonas sp. TPBH4]|uniref:dihydrofolate reductase family protein n=1 Tax=Mangrovimonas sp. TPBH4 TaxID=1645914 RepID=UPI0006B46700|nr:dihydrofolate reductase family protein [Mangrovimonas sp. TPBH4]
MNTNKRNRVYIATSLDGYIADKNGGIEWLENVPNPENDDMGYEAFMTETDAIIMGRNTFETVCSFDIPWPYKIPVFVLSNTLNSIPNPYQEHVQLLRGKVKEALKQLHGKGINSLYIDGGKLIQSFLKEDLIDELIITTIPILLGEGIPLFSNLDKPLQFECLSSKKFTNSLSQNHYIRLR